MQNREAFQWFDPIVRKRAATYHTAGALGDGQRVWILAKLPKDIRIVGEDVAHKFLLLSNSHDGQSSVQIKFTPVRVVCQNTLTMALSMGKGLRISHTPSLPLCLKQAEEHLHVIETRFADIEQTFQAMARVPMIDNRLSDYLALVFPEPKDKEDVKAMSRVRTARAKSMELFETGRGNAEPKVRGTLWAAYNGVTEYVDYFMASRSPASRLESIWFGNGYLAKARAYQLAASQARIWN